MYFLIEFSTSKYTLGSSGGLSSSPVVTPIGGSGSVNLAVEVISGTVLASFDFLKGLQTRSVLMYYEKTFMLHWLKALHWKLTFLPLITFMKGGALSPTLLGTLATNSIHKTGFEDVRPLEDRAIVGVGIV